MQKLNILVTGDKGFVGQATVELLITAGHNVFGYDLMDNCDIRDEQQLERDVVNFKINRILHLAAIARFSDADKDPLAAFETNVIGTSNVAKVAQRHHIPLVYASTGSVYMPIKNNPPITEDFPAVGNSVYGCTKALGEKIIQRQGSPWIVLRYAHLYGKEKRMHGLIGGFLERIERGLVPTLYGGKQSNDFTYIEDVAVANLLAVTAPWDKWNQVYNIGTGEELTAEQAGKLVCEAAGYKGKVETKEMREVDPMRFVYDISKAERMLGFKAKYNFADGLKRMFAKEE